jgi:hypothetical protein
MRIASTSDLGAGLLFMAFGAAALLLGQSYTTGTVSEMGPGYFPKALGLLLLGLGTAIALRALLRPGPAARPFFARPLLVLVGSVLLFAWLLDRAGIVVAGLLLVVGARAAAPGFRWREVLALGLGLTAAAALIFGYALGIPFQIWPG